MTLAHQDMYEQLTDDLRHAVLANARSHVMFQLPAADARLMAQQMGGLLTADDLGGLGRFEVVSQLYAGGFTQAPATGRTRSLSPPSANSAEILGRSRNRFGVDRDEIEAAIRKRQRVTPSGSVGRRRSHRSGGRHE
jgi:hypothetical protein